MIRKNQALLALVCCLALLLTGCTYRPITDNAENQKPTISEEFVEEVPTTPEPTEPTAPPEVTPVVEATEEPVATEEPKETAPPETSTLGENVEPETPADDEDWTSSTTSDSNADETVTQETCTVAVTGVFHYEEAKKTLDLVNQYRVSLGLNELTWDENLATAAKIRAAEASICWAHTRPNGAVWYTVSDLVKGENLAKGYATAQEAFDAWLASPDHEENISWPKFNTMYVAYFEAENGWFWAQEFGY